MTGELIVKILLLPALGGIFMCFTFEMYDEWRAGK